MPDPINHGLGLTPHITVSDGNAAIEFYKAAFGATELHRSLAPHSEKIMHATLEVHGSPLMLNDDFPEFMGGISRTPQSFGGSPVTLHLEVADADAAWEKAVKAGATVVFPLADQFWGARYGKLVDPFGHEWSIGQALRVVSEEEAQEAAEEFFVQQPVVTN